MPIAPKPFVTLRINGIIAEAECSLCRDPIPVGASDLPAERHATLRESFYRHMMNRHRGTLLSADMPKA